MTLSSMKDFIKHELPTEQELRDHTIQPNRAPQQEEIAEMQALARSLDRMSDKVDTAIAEMIAHMDVSFSREDEFNLFNFLYRRGA